MKNIFLNNYAKNDFLLNGYALGTKVRKDFHLNEEDTEEERVTIYIPDTIVGLTTSFFNGAFGPSIEKLGKIGFRKKYMFKCHINVENNLEDEVNTSILV